MQAIITDLDGTILPRGGTISNAVTSSLEELGKNGIVRIIATGRNLYSARKALSDNFPIDYLVFSSGAGIMSWQDKQILHNRQLTIPQTREIANYLWNYNINFTIQKAIPENHHFYHTDIYPIHPDYQKRIDLYKEFGTCISHSNDIHTPATQFVMILDALQLKLVEKIRRDLSAYSIVRSTSPIDNQAIWLEIFPQGINKGTVCSHLLNRLNIPVAECAGLGNDYNDVDFLDICGQAYLVSNAPLRLKPHYKTVAKDIDNGFIEFISLLKTGK